MRSRTSGGRPRSSRLASSVCHWAWSDVAAATSNVMLPEISHDSLGVKALISCSRSTTMRVATLWTLPALSPPATFFQMIGDT